MGGGKGRPGKPCPRCRATLNHGDDGIDHGGRWQTRAGWPRRHANERARPRGEVTGLLSSMALRPCMLRLAQVPMWPRELSARGRVVTKSVAGSKPRPAAEHRSGKAPRSEDDEKPPIHSSWLCRFGMSTRLDASTRRQLGLLLHGCPSFRSRLVGFGEKHRPFADGKAADSPAGTQAGQRQGGNR